MKDMFLEKSGESAFLKDEAHGRFGNTEGLRILKTLEQFKADAATLNTEHSKETSNLKKKSFEIGKQETQHLFDKLRTEIDQNRIQHSF